MLSSPGLVGQKVVANLLSFFLTLDLDILLAPNYASILRAPFGD